MKANVGNFDRLMRVVVGLILISLVFVLEGSIRWVGLIGIIPLGTAALKFCPLYQVIGFSSCPLKSSDSQA